MADVEADPEEQPQVVRRVYKVQYAEPPKRGRSRRAGVGGGDGDNMATRKMSMKAYDRSTDNDIFALGSAFTSGKFDINDFLKSFQKPLGGEKTGTYTVENITNDDNNPEQKGELVPWNKPKTMLTSIVGEGPTIVTRRQRIITTIANSGDKDGDQIVTQTTQVLTPDGQIISDTGPRNNFSKFFKQGQDNKEPLANNIHGNQETELPSIVEEPLLDDNIKKDPIETTYKPKFDDHKLKPIVEQNYDITEEDDTEDDQEEDTFYDVNGPIDNVKVDIQAPKPEDIEVKVEYSSEEEIDIEANQISMFRYFMKKKWKKKHSPRKHSVPSWALHGAEKGKTGMTTSEVLTNEGAEEQLHGIQKLIMNYNRMLDKNREQFLQALFRAVKLNGLDVVKILCQLVHRKSIKLSSEEMREPESSATVLHVALLYNHEDIVEYLVSLGDCDLILATYNNDEYRNQTALHVAVANGNHCLVNLLLGALKSRERRSIMNVIATGTYFQTKHIDGQLCLTAAAWSGSGEMLITLAGYGANFGLKNLDGDTLLHRIINSSVIYPEKMDYRKILDDVFIAVGRWASRCKYKTSIAAQKELEQTQKQLSTFQKLLNIRNNDGFTPLALAAYKGSIMLEYFMELEKIFKIPQTKLGSISWVTYDITDISSFATDCYNKFSVLHILAHQAGDRESRNDDDNEDHSFLDIEPIKSLIQMKWQVYRWVYIFWCLVHFAYMILFTYFTNDVNSVDHEHPPIKELPDGPYLHQKPVHYGFAALLILPVFYIILEFLDLFGLCPYSIFHMNNQSLLEKVYKRMKSEWVITGNGPYRCVCFGFCVFTIIWYTLYILKNTNQDIALSLAVLLGWIFVLFFTRGCRVTSRFSIMIQKMFFQDLMYFLAVYVVILMAFSFSVNVMYSKYHKAGGMLHVIFYKMMNIVTDLDEKESLMEARHPLFTKMMLIFYAIVGVILLMNMLIAMMNTSYETVRSTQCNLWKQQQLSIMLLIERRLMWWPWLAQLSEKHIWRKEWEEETRIYLDVTTGQ